MIGLLAIGGAALVASLLLSAAVLRYALQSAVLDIPTERSSHSRPTPRGGGLGLVLVVLAGLVLLRGFGVLDTQTTLALLGGGGLVAIVGWVDDVRGLSPGTRLMVHAVAAGWTVYWLGGMPSLVVGREAVRLDALGALLAWTAVVWATNLYNFMDGIDGLAAGEAAVVGGIATALLAGESLPLASVAAVIAGAAVGFLPWNWQRARIFMGDVGSGFLGFMFAGLALASENAGALPALVWLVLLGVFFVDATITLVRRVLRRESWYTPHRAHAYQRAAQSGWTHGQVAGMVLVINGFLAVLGWIASRAPELLATVLLLAATVLGAIYLGMERRLPMRMENRIR